MKKGTIFAIMALLAGLAGTGAVYQYVVKERIKQLGQHLAEEEKLRKKIGSLEEVFSRTRPDKVLSLWRQRTQPWADAVAERSRYYNMGELTLSHEVPQEVIPKFYFTEQYPKLVEDLYDYAYDNNCIIGEFTFGVLPPGPMVDTNPKNREVARWLGRYQYGSEMTKFIIDAGAVEVPTVVIWPTRENPPGRSGGLFARTVGYSIVIGLSDLVEFLDKLRTSDRFFDVEGLRIVNTDLTDPDPLITVAMVITQLEYRKTEPGSEKAMLSKSEVKDRLARIFKRRPGQSKSRRKVSGWKKFKKNFHLSWLPF